MSAVPESVSIAINRLVDKYRTRALWFLRADFYPTSHDARLRTLDLIQRHGDREGFVEAATLRQWLLQHSSDESAAS